MMNEGSGRRRPGLECRRRRAASGPVRYTAPAPGPAGALDSCSAVVTGARTAGLAGTLGLAAASWVVALRLVNGIGIGDGDRLGPFGVLAPLVGVDDGGDDAAGHGPGSAQARSGRRRGARSARVC